VFLLPERSALAKLSYAPNFPCGSYVFLEAIRKGTVEKQGIRGDSIRVQKQLLPELDCKRSTAGIAKSLKSSGCFPDSLLQVGGGWSTPTEGAAVGGSTGLMWLVHRTLRADQRHEAAGR
jgi:hypothetical protein